MRYWKNPARRRSLAWAGALLLLVLYGLSAGRFYLGFFNDDLRHLLAARALLEGHYNDLTLPFRSPAVNLLPGYPLLIALPFAVCGPLAVRALSVVFSLLAVFFMWRLAGERTRFAAVLFALHPLHAALSGTIMTEPAYLFWSLSSLYWLKHLQEKHILPFALWVSFAAWIRPPGILLPLALLPFALKKSPKRTVIQTVLASIALIALPYLRNLWVAGVPASYFDEITRAPGVLASAKILGAGLFDNAAYYFVVVPSSLVPAGPLFFTALGLVLCAAVWLLLAWGARAAWREQDFRPRLAYLFLMGAMHLFWVNHSERYLLVILPFLFELLILPFSRRPVWTRRLLGGVLAAVFLFQSAGGAYRTGPRLPEETLEWARRHTKPSDVFVAPRRQFVYYYTGRKTFNYFYHEDPDEFFEYMLRNDIRYGWIDRSQPHLATTPARRAQLDLHRGVMEARLRDQSRFRLVYQNPRERMSLYETIPSPAFLSARSRLPEVFRDLAEGRFDSALEKLRRLEREKAPLHRLDFLIGTTSLLAGRPQAARSRLESAYRKEPRSPRVRANLCRSYLNLGDQPPSALCPGR